MFLETNNKNECCGCTACFQICPVGAISMTGDEEGFLYPEIDEKKCINCRKCITVCRFGAKEIKPQKDQEIYAFKNKSDMVREKSSSGGAFYAFAKKILSNGGVVFGCAFDDQFCACHIQVKQISDLYKIQKSKYVQSDLKNTFKEVRDYLQQGTQVLFSGTACQVDGLLSYLGKTGQQTDNLVTCDIVCHGVPSPLVFELYLQLVAKGKKIKDVCFRYKTDGKGWTPLTMRIETDEYIYMQPSYNDIFYRLFFGHYIIRPSCHICKYANLNRISDITIADYWGIENSHEDMVDDLGISLLLINSKAGKKLFESIMNKHTICKSNAAECIQPNLQRPTSANEYREQFWQEYKKNGFKYVAHKYGEDSFILKFRKKIVGIIKRIVLFK